nr:sigma-54-dependent Fis family transcriptional regulator [Desulfobulbaceae bacterium]
MASILIIEKEQEWRDFLGESLSGNYQISYCTASKDLGQKIKLVHFDVILLDLGDGEGKFLNIISEVKRDLPFTPVIITCRTEKAELVVAAVKQGAFDFVIKPYTATKIKVSLEKALENVSLKNEIDYLRREQDVIYDINKIIAHSSSMKQVIVDIRKFSKTDSTILMTGETGTGKSLLSGAIHYNSLRRGKPFVTINCANIQETLLESELFGHEKGAFTGADKLRIGRFEQANGGSIFLDEIGEMSLALQAKLLRVIEDKAFERVGGNRTIHSDVRIIAATNKNLEKLVANGEFREDLFYRINVLPIRLPALRNRKECLVPLSYYLLDKIGRSMHKTITGFSDPVLRSIKAYSWPGNIRQLANTVERALLLEENSVIHDSSFFLPVEVSSDNRSDESVPAVFVPPERHTLIDSEKDRIIQALEESLWIQKDAALLLGISPRVLNHKIKKFGITHSRWRRNR